jgi:hypothetical protein
MIDMDKRQQHAATLNDFEKKDLTQYRKRAIVWLRGYMGQFGNKEPSKEVYIGKYTGVEKLQENQIHAKLKFK